MPGLYLGAHEVVDGTSSCPVQAYLCHSDLICMCAQMEEQAMLAQQRASSVQSGTADEEQQAAVEPALRTGDTLASGGLVQVRL